MKNLLLSIFLFVISVENAASQTNNNLWQLRINNGLDYLKVSEYQLALNQFELAFKFGSVIFNSKDSEIGTSHYYLGYAHSKLNNNSKAIDHFFLGLKNMIGNEIQNHPQYYLTFEELVHVYKNIDDYHNMVSAMILSTPTSNNNLDEKVLKSINSQLTKGFLSQLMHSYYTASFFYKDVAGYIKKITGNDSNLLKGIGFWDKSVLLYQNISLKYSFDDLIDGYLESFGGLDEIILKKYPYFKYYKDFLWYETIRINVDPNRIESIFPFINVSGIFGLKDSIKNIKPKNLPFLKDLLNAEGTIFHKIGDFNNAQKSFKESFFFIQSKALKNYTHRDVELMINYTNSLKNAGNYEEVEKLYLASLNRINELDKNYDVVYKMKYLFLKTQCISNLADYYTRVGNYLKTEILLVGLIDEINEVLNKIDKNEIGDLWDKINKYKIVSYSEVLKLFAQQEEWHKFSEFQNLKHINEDDIDYLSPENMYLENLKFKVKMINSDGHIKEYIELMENLWLPYSVPYKVLTTGDTGWKSYHKEWSREKTKNDTLSDLKYGKLLKDYANALFLNKEYSKSIKTFKHVEDILDFNYNNKHQEFGDLYYKLSEAYIKTDSVSYGMNYLIKANTNYLNQIDRIFKFGNTKEKKNYLKVLSKYFNNVKKLSVAYPEINEIKEISLNNELILKGLLLNSTKSIFDKLKRDGDSTSALLIESYRKTKNYLSAQYSIPKVQRIKNTDSLEVQLNNIERKLTKYYRSKNYPQEKYTEDWNNIKNKLKTEEIAIEFSHYKEGNNVQYLAYIISKDSEAPILVSLFKETQLKDLMQKNSINQLYETRGSKSKSISMKGNIYDIVWKPLESYVKSFKKIYFSPSGVLNQIPFAALSKDDKLLCKKYELIQLNSTKLVEYLNKKIDISNSLLIGGVDYNYSYNKNNKSNEESFLKHLVNENSSRSFKESWNYLAGTLEEVYSLGELYNQENISYKILTGKKASEEAFKLLDGNSPSVLHIATHGFFFENKSKISSTNNFFSNSNVYQESKDPLLRSGLVFAGANYTWKHGGKPYEEEDGILTALEISNLDLSKTKMVVLSACETGLGDIDGSEGVYGLQRAFKIAGVDIIVMSLWEVPDKETAEFMNLFYKNWLGGMKVREAFNQTQRNMSSKYKDSPQKWAAFVLVE